MIRSASVLVSALVFVFVSACGKGGGGAPPIAQKDGADGLQAVFAAAAAACDAKDYQKGKALTLSVIPGKDQLTKILKADAPGSVIDELLAHYKQMPPDDAKVACVFVPGKGRTEIRVHASSVEDLIAYKEGTPAFAEFPGGARKVAEQLLKPGTTFYEVEVTEPGHDSGTKYHMFFWDGGQWKMLGPAWRALRD